MRTRKHRQDRQASPACAGTECCGEPEPTPSPDPRPEPRRISAPIVVAFAPTPPSRKPHQSIPTKTLAATPLATSPSDKSDRTVEEVNTLRTRNCCGRVRFTRANSNLQKTSGTL